jgi:hypothetical protein
MGPDRIEAEIDGDVAVAVEAVRRLPAVAVVSGATHGVTVRVLDGAACLPAVAAALAASGVQVRRLTVCTPTLDDVFAGVTAGNGTGRP